MAYTVPEGHEEMRQAAIELAFKEMEEIMEAPFYCELNIKAKMRELVRNMGAMAAHQVASPEIPLQEASIQYFTSPDLSEPQERYAA